MNMHERIEALRREASGHGDDAQVELCELALLGDQDAYDECVRVLLAEEEGEDR